MADDTDSHPLDRPIWHALAHDQAKWATANGAALRYDPMVASFAATRTDAMEDLADVAPLIQEGAALALFTTRELSFPDTLHCIRRASVLQMVLSAPAASFPAPTRRYVTRALGAADSAAAQDLVTLTNPGPFARRTMELGHFQGVFADGALVAMVGERMRLPGFVEISAVCTHPDHRGQGLAQYLLALVAARIQASGRTPFLHAFANNQSAISVYQRLGFDLRRAFNLAVLRAA